MNNKKTFLAGLLALGLMHVGSASAVIMFDQDVTPDVIFGSGNANGFFTVDVNTGIEVGLRAKLRHDATGAPQNIFNSNGDGTYSFDAGVAPTQASPTAVWSVEWSINADANDNPQEVLDSLTYELGIDSDPTVLGTSFASFDPINGANPGAGGAVFWDHAIGDDNTGNGGGTVATDAAEYASLISSNTVAQNSWKAHWILDGTFDPTVDGTYDFYLAAFDGGQEVVRTEIQVIVGTGTPAQQVVPEPAALVLLSAGLLGIGYAKKRARG